MLDTKFILANLDLVERAIVDKQSKNEHTDLQAFVRYDKQRREAQTESDELTAQKKILSKHIGPLMGKLKNNKLLRNHIPSKHICWKP